MEREGLYRHPGDPPRTTDFHALYLLRGISYVHQLSKIR
jgi:hypothetical protein